jgi:hypothetical protein
MYDKRDHDHIIWDSEKNIDHHYKDGVYQYSKNPDSPCPIGLAVFLLLLVEILYLIFK